MIRRLLAHLWDGQVNPDEPSAGHAALSGLLFVLSMAAIVACLWLIGAALGMPMR